MPVASSSPVILPIEPATKRMTGAEVATLFTLFTFSAFFAFFASTRASLYAYVSRYFAARYSPKVVARVPGVRTLLMGEMMHS